MEEKDVTTATRRMALLMEQFQRRGTAIDQRFEQTQQTIEKLSGDVPIVLRHAADEALETLPDRVLQAVENGLGQSVRSYEARLTSTSSTALNATQVVARQVERLERLHRHLVWKVVGVVGGSVAVMTVAALWMSSYYVGIIRDNQVQAEILRAYNAADVTLCDGRLCANVDMKGAKFGERGEYRLVRSR